MSEELQYFRYIVAQYAHSRREERLNVGVIVHDPLRTTVRSQFDTKTATRRIKYAFPDVDSRGLTVFLKDLGEAVMANPGLNNALDQPDALKEFSGGWRNAIQFTPVRSLPAKNIAAALDTLMRLYVVDIPAELHQVPAISGIPFANTQTKRALRDILRLEEGVNYGDYRAEREVFSHGKRHRIPIVFPFYVYEQFVIDTLSFRVDSFPRKFDIASGFIQKVEALRKSDGGDLLVPCVSYVADEDKRDETEALIAQIQDKAGLLDEMVVEATQADVLAFNIGERHKAA